MHSMYTVYHEQNSLSSLFYYSSPYIPSKIRIHTLSSYTSYGHNLPFLSIFATSNVVIRSYLHSSGYLLCTWGNSSSLSLSTPPNLTPLECAAPKTCNQIHHKCSLHARLAYAWHMPWSRSRCNEISAEMPVSLGEDAACAMSQWVELTGPSLPDSWICPDSQPGLRQLKKSGISPSAARRACFSYLDYKNKWTSVNVAFLKTRHNDDSEEY